MSIQIDVVCAPSTATEDCFYSPDSNLRYRSIPAGLLARSNNRPATEQRWLPKDLEERTNHRTSEVVHRTETRDTAVRLIGEILPFVLAKYSLDTPAMSPETASFQAQLPQTQLPQTPSSQITERLGKTAEVSLRRSNTTQSKQSSNRHKSK